MYNTVFNIKLLKIMYATILANMRLMCYAKNLTRDKINCRDQM